jgi:hypothetical protein
MRLALFFAALLALMPFAAAQPRDLALIVIPRDIPYYQCEFGETRCAGSIFQKCTVAGVWGTVDKCSRLEWCTSDGCVPRSTNKVTGGVSLTFWPARSKTVVATCVNGRMKCNGNQVMQCRDHEWKIIKTCGVNEYCDPRNWKCLTVTKALRKGSLWKVPPARADCAPVFRPYRGYEEQPGCPQG